MILPGGLQPGSYTSLAVAGPVVSVPKNGDVEVTTLTSRRRAFPSRCGAWQCRPEQAAGVEVFVVAVNVVSMALGAMVDWVSRCAVASVLLAYVKVIPDCGLNAQL